MFELNRLCKNEDGEARGGAVLRDWAVVRPDGGSAGAVNER